MERVWIAWVGDSEDEYYMQPRRVYRTAETAKRACVRAAGVLIQCRGGKWNQTDGIWERNVIDGYMRVEAFEVK